MDIEERVSRLEKDVGKILKRGDLKWKDARDAYTSLVCADIVNDIRDEDLKKLKDAFRELLVFAMVNS